MSFTNGVEAAKKEIQNDTKDKKMIALVMETNPEEAESLRKLIYESDIPAPTASIIIEEEMHKYTDKRSLQTLSPSQIARIRKRRNR